MKFIKYLTIETNGDMSLSDVAPWEGAGGVTYQLIVIVPQSWHTVVGDIILTPPDETPIVSHRRATAK